MWKKLNTLVLLCCFSLSLFPQDFIMLPVEEARSWRAALQNSRLQLTAEIQRSEDLEDSLSQQAEELENWQQKAENLQNELEETLKQPGISEEDYNRVQTQLEALSTELTTISTKLKRRTKLMGAGMVLTFVAGIVVGVQINK